MSEKWLKEYFSFTKKERVGVITLLLILVFIWFLPDLFPKKNEFDSKAFESFQNEVLANWKPDSAVVVDGKTVALISKRDEPVKFSPFYFDPNSLAISGWRQLGLTDRNIQIIQNYLSRGGKFRKPEDLQKIYGLSKEFCERLIPFVRIKETEKEDKPPPKFASTKKEEREKPVNFNIDINKADTAAWIALPGIGSRLAFRIVSFREKLGGFYTVSQVGETFGLRDSAFQAIKGFLHCDSTGLKKIDLNTATLEEMKSHPYLKYSLANAIFQFRLQHGNFGRLDELRKIMVITDDIFTKITPYLTVR